MLDWSGIVAAAMHETQGIEPEGGCSYSESRNKGTDVGTENEMQAIEVKQLHGSCSDVPTVPHVFDKAKVRNVSSRESDAGGWSDQEAVAPESGRAVRGCRACAWLRRPGLSGGYCAGRDDLPRAYGQHHPLRRLPDDGGMGCGSFLRGSGKGNANPVAALVSGLL